jgi:uncharacterized membrane protein YcjF (UPF0283 family)
VSRMELAVSLSISVFLLAFATVLMVWHVRAWRGAQARPMDDREREYRRRQFRRRMQTTAMLAGLALALPVGQWVMKPWPKVGVVVWGLVLVILIWIAMLALADIVATKIYYGRLHDQFLIEQARLKGELRRIESKLGSNGKAKDVFRRAPERKDPGAENSK